MELSIYFLLVSIDVLLGGADLFLETEEPVFESCQLIRETELISVELNLLA